MSYKKILLLLVQSMLFRVLVFPEHELQGMPLLQEDDRIITQLLETIEDLMKQSPELFRNEPLKPEKSLMTPTPPRRNRVSKYSEARL